MYANITSHNVKTGGVSSGGVFEYLDKENQKIRENGGREINLVIKPEMIINAEFIRVK